MYKKLLVGMISFLLLGFATISADDSTPKEVAILLGEEYDAINKDKLSRFYQLADGSSYYMEIPIPKEIQETVSSAEDPLLEAKKQLATLYIVHGEEDRLKELNNERYYMFSEEMAFSIEASYQQTFEEQMVTANAYAKGIAEDPELRKGVPNVSFGPYLLEERQALTDKAHKEQVEQGEQTKQVDKNKKETSKEKQDATPYVVGAIVFLIVLVGTVIVFKRNNRMKEVR